MKKIIASLSLAFVVCADADTNKVENPYLRINERNAFNLTEPLPVSTLPPATNILAPSVFLTGITKINNVRKAHFVLRKTSGPDKFVSLSTDEEQDNIELNKIFNNSVSITNNGVPILLSFEKHGLPTVITKKPAPKLMERSRYSRDSKGGRDSKSDKEKKEQISKKPSGPVVVPSRRSRSESRSVDPRIIERGLEYISKMDDSEKREYLLKRIESYQAGRKKDDRK